MNRSLRFLLALVVIAALGAGGDADAGSKARRIPVSRISEHIVVVDGEALVPLADLGKATGCALTLVTKSDSKSAPQPKSWVAWPCAGGVLEVDTRMLKIAGKSSPGAEQGFDPQPDPPAELRIGTSLVSRKVSVQVGDPHLPLAEIVRLMGGKLEMKDGKGFIVVPRKADAVLRPT